MKIKTIRKRLDYAVNFDKEVNDALAEGWHLAKREVLDGRQLGPDAFQHRMLYAEMVRLDPEPEPQEIDPMEAAHAVHAECSKHESCTTCPLENYCTCTPPHEWGKEAEA